MNAIFPLCHVSIKILVAVEAVRGKVHSYILVVVALDNL